MFRVVTRKVQFSISRDIMLMIPVDSHRLGANICQQSGRDFHSQDGLPDFLGRGKVLQAATCWQLLEMAVVLWIFKSSQGFEFLRADFQIFAPRLLLQRFIFHPPLRTHLSWQDWWSSNSHGTSWTSSVTRSLIPNLPGEMLPKYMGKWPTCNCKPRSSSGMR